MRFDCQLSYCQFIKEIDSGRAQALHVHQSTYLNLHQYVSLDLRSYDRHILKNTLKPTSMSLLILHDEDDVEI